MTWHWKAGKLTNGRVTLSIAEAFELKASRALDILKKETSYYQEIHKHENEPATDG